VGKKWLPLYIPKLQNTSAFCYFLASKSKIPKLGKAQVRNADYLAANLRQLVNHPSHHKPLPTTQKSLKTPK
jgi:hypothetical protein